MLIIAGLIGFCIGGPVGALVLMGIVAIPGVIAGWRDG